MAAQSLSSTRILSAVIAGCMLGLLVATVTVHGDNLYYEFARSLNQVQAQANRQGISRSNGPFEGGGGLDLIECMCAWQPDYGVSGWVGLWLVTVVVGGIPTAILLRSSRSTD